MSLEELLSHLYRNGVMRGGFIADCILNGRPADARDAWYRAASGYAWRDLYLILDIDDYVESTTHYEA